MLEHVPNMLLVRDARDLRFVRLNRAGEQLLGYTRAELLGKNAHDVFAAGEAESSMAEDRATLASGVPLDIAEEAVQTRNNGVRYLHTKKIPVIDEQGKAQYLLGSLKTSRSANAVINSCATRRRRLSGPTAPRASSSRG